MRRAMILMVLLILFGTMLGSYIAVNPWPLRGGRISLSMGYPTLGLRYGLMDFAEVGASIREEGGYIKLGYGMRNFAFSLGFATVGYESSNIFGALGLRFKGFELDLGAKYFQKMNYYEGEHENAYSLILETSYLFPGSGNMENGFGLFGTFSSGLGDSNFTDMGLGFYVTGRFHEVWFFKRIDLMGGMGFKIDDSFDIFEDAYVIFDISTFFDIFKR